MLAILSQIPFVGLAEDRKAFEPYRQCVLSHAHKEYSSGADLKTIFERSEKACATDEAGSAADMALNAADRAIQAATQGGGGEYGGDRWSLFERELLFELAKDFVPKAN